MNESMLTGESRPVSKQVRDKVTGGAINGEGSITIEIQKTGDEAFIFGIIKLVREAQASKSKTQNLANRAAVWLTVIALGGGILTFSIWLFATSQGLSFAMERSVTVMVITCPPCFWACCSSCRGCFDFPSSNSWLADKKSHGI